jgi:hypothetical protein
MPVDMAIDSSVMDKASHLPVGTGAEGTPVLRPNLSG